MSTGRAQAPVCRGCRLERRRDGRGRRRGFHRPGPSFIYPSIILSLSLSLSIYIYIYIYTHIYVTVILLFVHGVFGLL